ncbi:Crp/Fnr family transcriptional regulator [Muricoccus radiodurans]|uniref:Crp/Fnr family transcriptional regulator n=1 Tax=Muricoccus radiodurans TaxID=2231721 RepID=UPI003CE7462A
MVHGFGICPKFGTPEMVRLLNVWAFRVPAQSQMSDERHCRASRQPSFLRGTEVLYEPITSFEPHSPLLSDNGEEIASAALDTLMIPARRPIIREGERPEHIHMLLSGMACRFRVQRDGSRQIIAFLFPGDFCDLQLFGKSEYAVSAMNVCKVALFSRAHLGNLVQHDASLGLALLRESAWEASATREWLVTAGLGKAERQMAHLFCEIHTRLGNRGETGPITYSLPLTQADVADALGLSPVHVNRVLMVLRKRGLVSWSGGVLSILDLAGLEILAEFNPAYLPSRERAAATRVALQNALTRPLPAGANQNNHHPAPIEAEMATRWAMQERLEIRRWERVSS